MSSLSKQSNLAGYRAGFVAGCSDLVGELLAVRKHLGLMPPAPVQAAMIAALGDDAHVDGAARAVPRTTGDAARRARGVRASASTRAPPACTSGRRAARTHGRPSATLADHGILVTPGTFYGAAGAQHVRVALTATDDGVAEAARRLEQVSKH